MITRMHFTLGWIALIVIGDSFPTLAQDQRYVDMSVVPGTRFRSFAVYSGNKYVNCIAQTETKDAVVEFGLLQKGTFALAIRDEYQMKAVDDSLGLKEGSTYQAVISISSKTDKKVWDAELEWNGDAFLLYPNRRFLKHLLSRDVEEFSLTIAQISHRGGYEIRGFGLVYDYLQRCFQKHGR